MPRRRCALNRSLLVGFCPPLRNKDFQGQWPLFGKLKCSAEQDPGEDPSSQVFAFPSPSMNLAGKAVQSKHRFRATANTRLGNIVASTQAPGASRGNRLALC